MKHRERRLVARVRRVILGRVGDTLNNFPDKQIWVQGHTDDVPISDPNSPFPSNWELSAARALTVVHYLQDDAKVDPKRLAAVAFGQHRPISRKVKARNRRIEIYLVPLPAGAAAKFKTDD